MTLKLCSSFENWMTIFWIYFNMLSGCWLYDDVRLKEITGSDRKRHRKFSSHSLKGRLFSVHHLCAPSLSRLVWNFLRQQLRFWQATPRGSFVIPKCLIVTSTGGKKFFFTTLARFIRSHVCNSNSSHSRFLEEEKTDKTFYHRRLLCAWLWNDFLPVFVRVLEGFHWGKFRERSWRWKLEASSRETVINVPHPALIGSEMWLHLAMERKATATTFQNNLKHKWPTMTADSKWKQFHDLLPHFLRRSIKSRDRERALNCTKRDFRASLRVIKVKTNSI